ncbi:hypothetical protein QYF36_014507 [Acer negundo]|nr:hypothetical protein QYF36_014507 [Acer negundo]
MMVNTKTGKIILPILCDGDVEFVLVNTECTPVVFVEVVERPVAASETIHVNQTPIEAIPIHPTSCSKDAEDKAGGGNRKEAVGKPSECGTSRNADKKRKRMPNGESSESYEADNGDEHEDVDLAAHNFGLNTGHPTRRNSRQKQNVSYCKSKNEDNDFVNPAKSSNGIKLSNASEEEEKEVDPELLNYPGPEFNRSSCLIYPKKGEIWALFRDWHIKWSDNPEKHELPYQYESGKA